MLKSLMIVGCGSFVGGALRYLLTRTVQNWIDGWMPACRHAGCQRARLLADRSVLRTVAGVDAAKP